MYTTYEGTTTRLRPFSNEEEWAIVATSDMMSLHSHWGPMYVPYATRRKRFGATGLLGGDQSSFAVIDSRTGEVVGAEGYSFSGDNEGAAYVGTWILPQYRNKGYGTQAKQLAFCHLFENFSIELILGVTVGSHSAGIAGLLKSGMQKIGSKPCMIFSRGKYESLDFFGLQRLQWESAEWRHDVKRSA